MDSNRSAEVSEDARVPAVGEPQRMKELLGTHAVETPLTREMFLREVMYERPGTVLRAFP